MSILQNQNAIVKWEQNDSIKKNNANEREKKRTHKNRM
jgi:hypothetical protein